MTHHDPTDSVQPRPRYVQLVIQLPHFPPPLIELQLLVIDETQLDSHDHLSPCDDDGCRAQKENGEDDDEEPFRRRAALSLPGGIRLLERDKKEIGQTTHRRTLNAATENTQ